MLAITGVGADKDLSRDSSLNSVQGGKNLRQSLSLKRTSTRSVSMKGIMSLKFDLEEGAKRTLFTWKEIGERIIAG